MFANESSNNCFLNITTWLAYKGLGLYTELTKSGCQISKDSEFITPTTTNMTRTAFHSSQHNTQEDITSSSSQSQKPETFTCSCLKVFREWEELTIDKINLIKNKQFIAKGATGEVN
uniref:Uncharacterized protein n=1 Tax=Meloidogyne hapla TaxID=6305 RepID=A0A1I8BCV0_MELHA